MRDAVSVPVGMKVNSRLDEAPNDVGAEPDQHDADGELEEQRDPLRQDRIERQHDRAHGKERGRMAQAPSDAHAERVARTLPTAHQGRHGRDMVRLDGVLHADQQSEKKYRAHRIDAAATLRSYRCFSQVKDRMSPRLGRTARLHLTLIVEVPPHDITLIRGWHAPFFGRLSRMTGRP